MSDNEPLDLEPIEARLAKATPGPWGYKEGFLKYYVFSLDKQEDFGISIQEFHWQDGHEVPAAANAQFIANAPADVAALVAEVHRLRHKINHYAEQNHLKYCGEDELFFPPYPAEKE